MKHESDDNTSCNWCPWYSHQRICTRSGGLGNKRTSGDHPNYYIIEFGQNFQESTTILIKWELCKKFKFDHTNKWYMHNTESILENSLGF